MSSVCSAADPVELSAYHLRWQQGRMEVRWAVRAWPGDLGGFSVRVRMEDPQKQLRFWDSASVGPIRPDLTLAAAERWRLPRVAEALITGRLVEQPPAVLMPVMRSVERDRIVSAWWEETEMLAVHGLGCVIPVVMPSATYSVSLRAIRGGVVEDQPLTEMMAVAITTPPRLVPVHGMTAVRDAFANAVVTWQVQAEDWKRANRGDRDRMRGFRVLGRTAGSEPWQELGTAAPSVPVQGVITCLVRVPPDARVAEIGVLAYSWTGADADAVSAVVVVPPILPELPVVPCTATVTGSQVDVTWQAPGGLAHAGWRILRQVAEGPFVVLTPDPVDRRERRFVDLEPPQGRLSYRVDAISGDGRVDREGLSSSRVSMEASPVPPPAPPRPTATRAVVRGAGGWRFDLPPAIPGVEHVLEARPAGSDDPWSSCRFPSTGALWAGVQIRFQDRYEVRWLASSSNGTSRPGPWVVLPTWTPDPPPRVQAFSIEARGEVMALSWVVDASDVVGFRLREGNRILLNTDVLGPQVRSWSLPSPGIGTKVEWTLSVVGLSGEGEPFSTTAVTQFLQDIPRPLLPPGASSRTWSGTQAIQVSTPDGPVIATVIEERSGARWLDGAVVARDSAGVTRAALVYQRGQMHGLQRWYRGTAMVYLALYRDGRAVPLTTEEQKALGESLTAADREWLATSR